MTCIATLVTPYYTLQVSDRLLTSGSGPFDARANKALIIGTRRGIVSVAFSGAAFVNGGTTDQRIAEQVTQTELDQDATSLDSAPVAPSIGHVLRALVKYFSNSREWRHFQSEFVATGWQWELRGSTMRKYRQVLYCVKTVRPTGPLACSQEIPRHLPERRGVGLRISGMDPFTVDERRSYLRRLTGGAASRLPPPDDAEAVLVQLVRAAADRTKDVGRDCMSILLPQSEPWMPRVNYLPLTDQRLTWVESGDRVPIRYTPWVVHGGVAFGPKIVMGVKALEVGGLTVRVNCPSERPRGREPGSLALLGIQGLHRPLPPSSPRKKDRLPPGERIFSE